MNYSAIANSLYYKELRKPKFTKIVYFLSYSQLSCSVPTITKIFGNAIGTRDYLIDQETGKIKEYILWDQCYEEDEIKRLMENNGLKIEKQNRELIKNEQDIIFIKAKKQ